MNEEQLARFAIKYVIDSSGCWNWTAGRTTDGYGTFAIQRRSVYAHRLSYEHYVAEIPCGLQIDHLCRHRACVNPSHLEPVTVGENVRRGNAGGRFNTHCLRGHEFNESKTRRRPNGTRVCIKCSRQYRYVRAGLPIPEKYQ